MQKQLAYPPRQKGRRPDTYMIIGGRGYCQEWGKDKAQVLNPGDVVNIPPEAKHWARRRKGQLVLAPCRGSSRGRLLERMAQKRVFGRTRVDKL